MRQRSIPSPNYDHLLLLTDDTGVLEHARFGVARRSHGYTTDDTARALVVFCKAADRLEIRRAISTTLSFVAHAIGPNGLVHNRLGYDRRWLDEPSSGDHLGRALWALGVAAVADIPSEMSEAALHAFSDVSAPTGPHLRPYALASLGATALLERISHAKAEEVLERSAEVLAHGPLPWPERRLTYDNGRIPHALLRMGQVTGEPALVDRGLTMLDWLHSVETREGRYSFVPVGGWAPGDKRPGFDQQPIEAAAMADAAQCAWDLTGDERWRQAVVDAAFWLMGRNDADTPLLDPVTGGCRDGLTRTGANANRGAESTICGISVLQAHSEVTSSVTASA